MSEFIKKLDRVTLIVIAVSLVVAGVVGVLAFRMSRDFFVSTSVINVDDTAPVLAGANQTAATAKPGEAVPTLSYQPGAAQVSDVPMPKWDGTSRVTVLIMGLDYRDWQTGTDVPRTDTMILFSIDPLTKTAGMLSIPRDMWVNIPGYGYSRINAAYRTGEMYKLPGGGMALAMKTVEQFTGVPVDYAALIDFNSFVRFIDVLGGLDMKIREPLKIDPIGPGNTRTLEPGTQTLDGQAVLAYARNRYTKDGDFDRSKRQQEVIMALRKQILQFNQLPMLIQKAPALYTELSSGIRTTLSLDQVIRLAILASQVDTDKIKRGVFDPHKDVAYATVNTAEGAADVLVPNPDQIRLLVNDVFVNGGAYGPIAAGGDLTALAKSEQAKVILRDGTGNPNLSQQASGILSGLGLQITGTESLGGASGATTIIDHTGKPYTAQLIAQKLNLTDPRVQIKFDPAATADIELVLGADYKGQ